MRFVSKCKTANIAFGLLQVLTDGSLNSFIIFLFQTG